MAYNIDASFKKPHDLNILIHMYSALNFKDYKLQSKLRCNKLSNYKKKKYLLSII